MTLAEYIEAGQGFDADEREVAALALQQLGVGEQAEIDASWLTELRRRVDDFQSGKAELLDYDEARAQLRAELATESR